MYADWLLAQADPDLQASGRLIAIANERTVRSRVELDEEHARLRTAAIGPRGKLLFARPAVEDWIAAGVDLDWRRGIIFRAGLHRLEAPTAALAYLLAMPAARFMTTLELGRADRGQLEVLETAPYLPPLRRLVLAGDRLGDVDALRERLPYLTALERRP